MKHKKTLKIFNKIYKDYLSGPDDLKLIDGYILYSFSLVLIQLIYVVLIGSFPLNSFISGFFSSLTSFVLGVALRLQLNNSNPDLFRKMIKEISFAHFIFGHIILHLFVFNMMG